jgi:hypothetical protein
MGPFSLRMGDSRAGGGLTSLENCGMFDICLLRG